MIKRLLALAGVATVSAVVAMPAHSQGKVTTLRAVSFIRLDIADGRWFKAWTERVNKACGAYVKVDLRGGPEVMNPFQQPVAIKNGVIDVALTLPAFMQRFIPWSLAYNLANVSPMEQRKNGAYKYMDGLINKRAGAHVLLNTRWPTRFHLFMAKKKLTSLDLSGLKFRTLPIYRPMIEKMGGTAITMNQSELYTALERGTVDGYGYISYDLKPHGWNKVTKYRMDPGFYHVSAVYVINLRKWQGLSQAGRDCLTKVSNDYEKHLFKVQTEVGKKGEVALVKNGVEIVKMPPEMAKKFLETARTAGWNDVKSKAPKEYPTLKKLLD